MGTALSLYLLNMRAGLRPFIKGFDYFRFREYLMADREIRGGTACTPGSRLLDIGCGEEIFGLYLAKTTGYSVSAIDKDTEKLELQRKYSRILGDSAGRFSAECVDAMRMNYADNSFDAASCFAVLPLLEGEGDIRIMREIGRVLKKGGIAYITVGYGSRYKEQRDEISTKGFSRVYDEEALQKRLIAPSGLAIKKRLYFGEPGLKFSRLWYRLPFALKLPLRWMAPLCTLAFLKSMEENGVPGEKTDNIDGIFLLLEKFHDQEGPRA